MSSTNGSATLAEPDMNSADVYELALVGIVMEHQDELPKAILHGIVADWFTNPLAKRIWETILDLHGRGQPFSPADVWSATAGEALISPKALERVQDFAPLCIAKIPHYAKKMRHRAAQAATGLVLREGAERADTEPDPDGLSQALGSTAQQLLEIGSSVLHEAALDPNTAARAAALECDRAEHGIVGVRTGISSLDYILGGFRPGEYVVLGARPSTGKTALAVTICANLLKADPSASIFFASADMVASEVLKRFFTACSDVPAWRIEKKQVTREERDRWDDAVGRIAASQLRVETKGMLDPAQIMAAATAHRNAVGRLDLIVVDHIHVLRAKAESRVNEITKISSAMRQMTHELAVPVLALAQLNRGVTQRDDKRPSMSDLRDSGSVEQDADICIFIHRPGVYDKQGDQTEAEIVIDKMRRGKTGTVPLHFNPETMRFTARERSAPFQGDSGWHS